MGRFLERCLDFAWGLAWRGPHRCFPHEHPDALVHWDHERGIDLLRGPVEQHPHHTSGHMPARRAPVVRKVPIPMKYIGKRREE